MEQTWIQRYEETKARYEEFCENRVDLMSQVVNSCVRKKRKVSAVEDMEQMTMKFKDKDDRIEMLESSNERLTDLVQKLKGSLKVVIQVNQDYLVIKFKLFCFLSKDF